MTNRTTQPGFYTGRSRLTGAIADFGTSFRHPVIWLTFALHESVGERRRAVLGLLWLPIALGIFVLGVGYLFSALLGKSFEFYFPYLAAGVLVWRFINGIVTEAPNTFTNRRAYIENVRLPLSTYPLILITKHLITLLFGLPVFIIVAIVFQTTPHPSFFLLIPVVLIYLSSALGVSLFLGVLSVRFKDAGQAIAAFMQLAFLLTPVVWIAEGTNRRAVFAEFNPFYHVVEIARSLMIGDQPTLLNWQVCIGLSLVFLISGFAFFAAFRRRIPYWL